VSELVPTTTTTTNETENDVLKDQRKLTLDNTEEKFDPVANFLFALNSPETKRPHIKKARGFP
jgi:hypothetical protein